MRCSIIRALASLIVHVKSGSDKTRDKLLGALACPRRGGLMNTCHRCADILAERVHDANTYGRSAALQAWADLATAQALPLTHVHLATDLAIERARDKTSSVRKQALALLATLVERNPYNGQLAAEFYVGKVQEVQAWLQEQGYDGDGGIDLDDESPAASASASASAKDNDDDDDDGDDENNNDNEVPHEDDDDNNGAEETAEAKTLRGKLEFLKYCKSALLFIARVERICADLCDLLLSTTQSDVQGALRFFATAHEFGLRGAEVGVRRMLCLVWDSRDSGAVKKELVEMFERLYIAKPSDDGKKRYALPPLQVAGNLVKLARAAQLDELTSLEAVVAETMKGEAASCVKRRVLPSTVIDALWTLAATAPPDEARVALCVIGMAAAASPAVADRPLASTRLIELGFGEAVRKRGDLDMPRYACLAVLAGARLPERARADDAERQRPVRAAGRRGSTRRTAPSCRRRRRRSCVAAARATRRRGTRRARRRSTCWRWCATTRPLSLKRACASWARARRLPTAPRGCFTSPATWRLKCSCTPSSSRRASSGCAPPAGPTRLWRRRRPTRATRATRRRTWWAPRPRRSPRTRRCGASPTRSS